VCSATSAGTTGTTAATKKPVAPRSVDAGEPDPVGPQQGQQAGDITDQTNQQDAAPTPAVGDQSPQRRADQHPGGVEAAEQSDMARSSGLAIGRHQLGARPGAGSKGAEAPP
jgi:hypothetical protein